MRESLQIQLIQIEQRDILDTPEQICRTGISKPHFLIQADGRNIAGYHIQTDSLVSIFAGILDA